MCDLSLVTRAGAKLSPLTQLTFDPDTAERPVVTAKCSLTAETTLNVAACGEYKDEWMDHAHLNTNHHTAITAIITCRTARNHGVVLTTTTLKTLKRFVSL